MMASLFFFSLVSLSLWGNNDYYTLSALQEPPPVWTPESTISEKETAPPVPISKSLGDFYKTLTEDKLVTIYLGHGYQAYHPNRVRDIFNLLLSLTAKKRLPLTQFYSLADQTEIGFRRKDTGVKYVIHFGHERNQFQKAFSAHEIVMYHGHSRYGRGPAFGSFWNYFRMGSVFPTIEVDTRNPYFHKEPIQLSEKYPLYSLKLGNQVLPFQYRGQKTESSYLPGDAFTKNIPGLDKDWLATNFLPGKQIFYFHSCKNINYFKKSIREKFPDTDEKFVFGTWKDGHWGSLSQVVFIASVAMEVDASNFIVDELNRTENCGKCFTSY